MTRGILFFLGVATLVCFILRRPRAQFTEVSFNYSEKRSAQETAFETIRPDTPNAAGSQGAKPAEENKQVEAVDSRRKLLPESLNRIERQQGRLLQRLHLQPAILESVRVISATREADVAFALKSDDANESPAETKYRIAQMNTIQASAKTALLNLLGPADYAKYSLYQQEIACQSTVDQIGDIMQALGPPPSSEQQDTILDAYTRATLTASDIAGHDPRLGDLNEEERDILRKNQIARFDSILAEEMSRSLDPEQFKFFMAVEYIQEASSR